MWWKTMVEVMATHVTCLPPQMQMWISITNGSQVPTVIAIGRGSMKGFGATARARSSDHPLRSGGHNEMTDESSRPSFGRGAKSVH